MSLLLLLDLESNNVSVEVSTGAISFSGQNLTLNSLYYPSTTSITLIGYSSTLDITEDQYSYPSTGSIVLTEYSITLNSLYYPSTTSITLTGNNVVNSYGFTPSIATLSISTYTIVYSSDVFVSTGQLSLSGNGVVLGTECLPAFDTVSFTGLTSALITDVYPITGSIVITEFISVISYDIHTVTTSLIYTGQLSYLYTGIYPPYTQITLTTEIVSIDISEDQYLYPSIGTVSIYGQTSGTDEGSWTQVGSITLSGLNIDYVIDITTSTGEIVFAPNYIELITSIFTNTEEILLTGNNITQLVSSYPELGSLIFTQYPSYVSISNNVFLSIQTGSVVFTSNSLLLDYVVYVNTESIIFTGLNIIANIDIIAYPLVGSLLISTLNPTLDITLDIFTDPESTHISYVGLLPVVLITDDKEVVILTSSIVLTTLLIINSYDVYTSTESTLFTTYSPNLDYKVNSYPDNASLQLTTFLSTLFLTLPYDDYVELLEGQGRNTGSYAGYSPRWPRSSAPILNEPKEIEQKRTKRKVKTLPYAEVERILGRPITAPKGSILTVYEDPREELELLGLLVE